MNTSKPDTSNFPNLFIPGAMKSGTSSLHELLDQHPDICMSKLKEPYYLVNENFDDQIEIYNEKYSNLFKSHKKPIFRGDSSTTYMLFPNFIDRVKAYVDTEVKFIFILRNPIDRIYSHYWYLKGLGSEHLNFKEAVKADMTIAPEMSKKLPEGKFKHYYQYGLYGKWLDRFYHNFDPKQILIILFEDLIMDPLKVSNDCFRFLDLEPLENIQEVRSNTSTIIRFPKSHKFLTTLTQGKYKITKPFHSLIPIKMRRYLKDHTSSVVVSLSKTKKVIPSLDSENRKWVKELYKNDVASLKSLTGLSLEQWQDFN